jgi:hypothetical protein
MYSHSQAKHLMVKNPTPDAVDDDDDHYITLPQIPPPKVR